MDETRQFIIITFSQKYTGGPRQFKKESKKKRKVEVIRIRKGEIQGSLCSFGIIEKKKIQ